jgi:hypothetical protein
MASEKQETSTFKASIEARIARWQAVLDALTLAQELDGADLGAVATPTVSSDLGRPIDLPKGAFHGKSVPVCVELYLSAGKVKRTNKEIAVALQKGGVESNAKNFETVVNGALFGLKQDGKVLRFDDGWGLAEWYPAHIRAATPIANGGSKKKKKKKAKKGARKNASAKPVAEPAIKPASKPLIKPRVPTVKPLVERVQDVLQSKPGADPSA